MSSAVLVTGATGFVGRTLLPMLVADSGRRVIALTRAPASALPPSVSQRIAGPIESLDAAGWASALDGIDAVIHLAGIAHVGAGLPEDRYDAVNHRATAAMAAAARTAGVRRIVFMSSIRAQAGAWSATALTEAEDAAPTEAYGRAKLAAERALAASGVDHVILRPVLVVGDDARGNLASLVRLAMTGWPLPLANIAARRSLVAVSDVARAATRALDDPAMAGRIFILAHPDAMTLSEMIAAVRNGAGQPPRLFGLPEGALSLPLQLAGRSEVWDRIGRSQVALANDIRRLGFDFTEPPQRVLAALGRAAAQRRRSESPR